VPASASGAGGFTGTLPSQGLGSSAGSFTSAWAVSAGSLAAGLRHALGILDAGGVLGTGVSSMSSASCRVAGCVCWRPTQAGASKLEVRFSLTSAGMRDNGSVAASCRCRGVAAGQSLLTKSWHEGMARRRSLEYSAAKALFSADKRLYSTFSKDRSSGKLSIALWLEFEPSSFIMERRRLALSAAPAASLSASPLAELRKESVLECADRCRADIKG